MLLDLLAHCDGVFYAAILPLIDGRDCRSLCALSAVNWRLNAAILALDWWQHCRKMRSCMDLIKSMNTLYNNYTTIRDFNGKITTYCCDRYVHSVSKHPKVFRVWNEREYYKFYDNRLSLYSNNIRSIVMPLNISGNIPSWLIKYNDSFSYITKPVGVSIEYRFYNYDS
jgi:hypothetical protein